MYRYYGPGTGGGGGSSSTSAAIPTAQVSPNPPGTTVSVVYFPGRVQNAERAVSMLGGYNAIERATKQLSVNGLVNLSCKLADQYLFHAPLCPAKKKRVCYCMVARCKKTGRLRHLANVDYIFTFSSMADYLYLAPQSLSYGLKSFSSNSLADEFIGESYRVKKFKAPPNKSKDKDKKGKKRQK